jgi:type IV pilus assembly protein PilY1
LNIGAETGYAISISSGRPNENSPELKNVIGGDPNLADVAEYLYENDLRHDLDEIQRLTTHTILAFQAHDPVVSKAASVSDGLYANAYNLQDLVKALDEIFNSILLQKNTSFVAPVVPTNPDTRTYSGERVYMGFFKPISGGCWQGNLKKFGIDEQVRIVDKNNNLATEPDGSFKPTAVSFWGNTQDGGTVQKGGAGERLLNNPSHRKIFTNDLSKLIKFENNEWILSKLDTDESKVDDLISFIYGEDRDWIMGDVLHSKPRVISYNRFNVKEEESKSLLNKTYIFVGSNDGKLRAIRDYDGSEAWAFIPDAVLPNLKYLKDGKRTYFVDSTPAAYIYDHLNDGVINFEDPNTKDLVILIFGLGRGGSAYYALNITNPENPTFLWKIDSTDEDFKELGQTWSEPQIGKVEIEYPESNEKVKKIVAFIGAGYDKHEDGRFGRVSLFPNPPNEDTGYFDPIGTSTWVHSSEREHHKPKGRGIYALNVATITDGFPVITPKNDLYLWSYTYDKSSNSTKSLMHYSFPSDITILDSNYNGYIDRLYVGDTGGRMWRFDISVHNTTKWSGNIIAFTGTCEYTIDELCVPGRKIFYRPSVTIEEDHIMVAFGTGDRSHPLNTTVTDRLYMIKDKGQGQQFVDYSLDTTQSFIVTDSVLHDATNYDDNTDKIYGWYIELDDLNWAGEKVLAPALIFNKVAYYTTYTPFKNLDDPCGHPGVSRLYAVHYKTAKAVLNFDKTNDVDGKEILSKSDRVTDLGFGIASGLVIVMPASGEAEILIGCGGGICQEDPLLGDTLKRIYWIQW